MTIAQNLPILRDRIRTERPLIHCITNHISINQCANGLLAMGAKPIMAEHREEVAGITASAQALMVNLGNITDDRMEAMKVSGETAYTNGIPCVLDLVGVGCSKLRLDFAMRWIEKNHPAVVKGNESEIRAVAGLSHHAKGIDNGEEDNLEEAISAAKLAARKLSAMILLSGKFDIVTDGEKAVVISNGDELMSFVTGTGCLQGAVTAAFLSVAHPFEAAVSGAVLLGIAGECAAEDFQTHGSLTAFGQGIIDKLYSLEYETLLQKAQLQMI